MKNIEGKTALVTGAGGGMGREVALELARRGAHVIVHARSEARAKPVVNEIQAAGGKAEIMACDLASIPALRTAAQMVREKHGVLHILVNNAGFWAGAHETTAEGHERTWATNVLAPFVLTHELLDPLRAGGGRVVNVSSREHLAGEIHWDDLYLGKHFSARRAYRQSKLALVMLTNALARREPALRANSVHPGVIATDLFRNMPWIVGVCIGAFCPSPAKGAQTIWRLALPDGPDANGKFFYKLKESPPHPMAADEAASDRLWEILQAQAAA